MEFRKYMKKRILVIVIWIVPFLLGVELLSHWCIYNYKVQIREHTSVITGEYVKSIEEDMDSLNREMKKIVVDYDYMRPLLSNAVDRQLAIIKIGDVLWDFMMERYDDFRCFLLLDNCSEYVELDGYVYRDSSYMQFQTEVLNWVRNDFSNTQGDRWRFVTIGEEVYFFSYYVAGTQAIGAWIKGDALVELAQQMVYGDGSVCIEAFDGTLLASSAGYESSKDSRHHQLFLDSTEDVLVCLPFLFSQYQVIFNIDAGSYVEGISGMQAILVCITGVILLFVFMLLYYIYRRILQPIHHFTEQLARYENEEEMDISINMIELEDAKNIFYRMKAQVKNLKIHLYEEQLENKRMQIDFLERQIKPHFYINCLNAVYSMAEQENYTEIQKMVFFVSDFIRYSFQSGNRTVRIAEELNHVKNYLEIQRIYYKDVLTYDMDVMEKFMDTQVPVLMIQTFVENIVKHASDMVSPIHCRICVDSGETPGMMRIRVCDNGIGFSERQLEYFNNGIFEWNNAGNGRGIGIRNCVSRMKLIYGDCGKINFYNDVCGGAVVEILCPLTWEVGQ